MVIVKQFDMGDVMLPVMIINLKGRSIVSVPTQIGCAIACKFCISSLVPFSRNLQSEEIIALVEFGLSFARSPASLISFTGEGEPFLNLKNINKAMYFLAIKESVKGFRLCTSGIKPGLINQVAQTLKPVDLQFSMHATRDDRRKEIIPKTKSLNEIIAAIKDSAHLYSEIAVNYVLMKGVNDEQSDLLSLRMLIPKNWVIKLNPMLDEGGEFEVSVKGDVFYEHLALYGHDVKQFNKVGSSIKNNFYGKLVYEKVNSIKIAQ